MPRLAKSAGAIQRVLVPLGIALDNRETLEVIELDRYKRLRGEQSNRRDCTTSEQSAREWESSAECDVWSARERASSGNVR